MGCWSPVLSLRTVVGALGSNGSAEVGKVVGWKSVDVRMALVVVSGRNWMGERKYEREKEGLVELIALSIELG
jgi:hypothetical protein